MCQGVKNSAYWKDTEAEEQEGFSSLCRSPFSNPTRADLCSARNQSVATLPPFPGGIRDATRPALASI
jgi:hypothetical protein